MKFEVRHKSYGEKDTYNLETSNYKIDDYNVLIEYTTDHKDKVEFIEEADCKINIKVNNKVIFDGDVCDLEHIRILIKLLDNLENPSQDISLHLEL